MKSNLVPLCRYLTFDTCNKLFNHPCYVLCRVVLRRYGVKSHLVPHCHYLKSLGITDEELPQLILFRPQVLVSILRLPNMRTSVWRVGGVGDSALASHVKSCRH